MKKVDNILVTGDQKSDQPLVSIALAVYNGEKTLSAAIKSILFQTYTNWELIIIDDGSTDGSLSIAKSFKDSRITVLANENNKSLPISLNIALDHSCGKYFARMDQDDVSFPERIEKQVFFMNEHSNIDLLGTAILYFHGDGSPLGVLPVREKHDEICSRPWSGFYLPHPTWLGRTEWFLKHHYHSCANAEDSELLFRTYDSSNFACLSDVLLAYREEQRTLTKLYKYRKAFFKAVMREAIRTSKYSVAANLLLLHPLKMLGDILNIKLGFRKLRGPVYPASTALLEYWNNLWYEVNK